MIIQTYKESNIQELYKNGIVKTGVIYKATLKSTEECKEILGKDLYNSRHGMVEDFRHHLKHSKELSGKTFAIKLDEYSGNWKYLGNDVVYACIYDHPSLDCDDIDYTGCNFEANLFNLVDFPVSNLPIGLEL